MKKKDKKIIWLVAISIAAVIALSYAGVISFNNLFNNSGLSVSSGSSNHVSNSKNSLFAAGDVCTPEVGYDFCDEYTDTYNGVTAHAKIQISDFLGTKRYIDGFYVGGAYVNVKATGTKLYIGKNVLWSLFDNNCNENGCSASGITQAPSLIYKDNVASVGQEYKDCKTYVAYTFAGSLNSDWVWVFSGYGNEGNGDCVSVRAVACYDNTDCQTGYACDKSAGLQGWANWMCKPKVCDIGQENCVGTTYQTCNPSTFNWESKGKTLGKCGVSCLSDSNCASLNTITNNTCTADNTKVVQYVTNGKCDINNQCTTSQTTQEISQCQFGCVNGVCSEKSNNFIIYIIAGIIIILTMIIIIWIIKRKRGRVR